MSKPRLIVASANPDKVAELNKLLGAKFEVVARPTDAPETVEDQDTLEGNALKKAQDIATFSGCITLADDTGLFVPVLGGDPGVRSARYAGESASYKENVDKLLHEMLDVEEEDRRAEFRTVIAILRPDGTGVTGEGSISGKIVTRRRGAGGFGYDAIFEPDEGEGRTFAQMASDEKHEISHRARALQSIEQALAHAPGIFE